MKLQLLNKNIKITVIKDHERYAKLSFSFISENKFVVINYYPMNYFLVNVLKRPEREPNI